MSLFLRVGRLQDGLFEDNYLDMSTVGKSKILRRWIQFENENSDMQYRQKEFEINSWK